MDIITIDNINSIMELYTQYLAFKAMFELVEVLERNRTHLWVMYITRTGIKVKKILIPKVIPSTGIKVMRLRGRTVGVRLYFSASAKNILKGIKGSN